MSYKVFLDMDGVLFDFVGGSCKVHGRPWPYQENATETQNFYIEQLWGMTPSEFWEPINNAGTGFWENLKPTAEAHEIVDVLEARFGSENIAILTSAMDITYAGPGKQKSIEKHFPQFRSRMIFTPAKKFLAGPDKILVDDWEENITRFRTAQGWAIRFPRPWNHGFFHKDPMKEFKRQVNSYE